MTVTTRPPRVAPGSVVPAPLRMPAPGEIDPSQFMLDQANDEDSQTATPDTPDSPDTPEP